MQMFFKTEINTKQHENLTSIQKPCLVELKQHPQFFNHKFRVKCQIRSRPISVNSPPFEPFSLGIDTILSQFSTLLSNMNRIIHPVLLLNPRKLPENKTYVKNEPRGLTWFLSKFSFVEVFKK